MKNLPNILTVARFFLVPVFVYVYFRGAQWVAPVIFFLASLTDLLDGHIARTKNLITDFGKVMDPLADKAMQIAVLACFCISGAIPLFVLIIAGIKEAVMVIGGILLYTKRDTVVFSNIYGKAATMLFFVGIVLTFFRDRLYPYNLWVIYLALALSIVSMVIYGIKNVINKGGDPKTTR